VEVVADQAPGLSHKVEVVEIHIRRAADQGEVPDRGEVPDQGEVHAAAEGGYTVREGDRRLTVSVVEAGAVGVVAEVAAVGRGEEQAHLWDRDRGGTLGLDGHLHLLRGAGYSSLQLS